MKIFLRDDYIAHSHKTIETKRKELKKQGKNKEEIKEQLAALKKSTLTYKEEITSILERIDSKKYYVNGKYHHKAYISKDLKPGYEHSYKDGNNNGVLRDLRKLRRQGMQLRDK